VVERRQPNPEWTRREIVARAVIGLTGGVIGTVVSAALWTWTRTAFDRFLVDRVVFIAISTIVVSFLLRAWYRKSARADLLSA
jgi:H+/Cl- antiporter ClcA